MRASWPCRHAILIRGVCYYCGERLEPTCEGHRDCPNVGKPTPSQTMYGWDDQGEDPNRDLILCDDCGGEYTDMMNDQWNDYYGGLL